MRPPTLDRLRREIAATDLRILRDLSRRLRLARQVGRLKRDRGLPVRDYQVEREVIRRWVAALRPCRVPLERVENLVRWVIEESVYAQETVPEAARPREPSSDVVVVGGLGQMGGWIRDFLRTAGLRVGVVELRRPSRRLPFPVHTDLRRAVASADLVVLATPMRATPRVYQQLIASETTATVFDILSIKTPVLPWIRQAVKRGMAVSSAHPLFGPSTRSLLGRNFLVLDCGHAAATDRVAGLFRPTALHVSVLPLELHDPLMTDVLGLPHVLSLLFARTLQSSPRTVEQLRAGGTTSFQRIVEVAQIVTRENPELVGDIQTLNPASSELFGRLGAALSDLRAAALAPGPARYAALLQEGRSHLGQALDEHAAAV